MTLTLAREFRRIGHKVDIFTPGPVSYLPEDFPVINRRRKTDYDFAIVNHKQTVQALLESGAVTRDRIIQTVHGIGWNERPHESADIKVVAVTDEIRRHLINNHHVTPWAVIPNGVELAAGELWEQYCNWPSRGIQNVFVLSQSIPFTQTIERVCAERKYRCIAANKRLNPMAPQLVRKQMQLADVVVSLGLGAVEGMATGRCVLVADAREYQGALSDGWLNEGSYDDIADANFSGRTRYYKADYENVCTILDDYRAEDGKENRELAEMHHDIRVTAQMYMELLHAWL